MVFASVYLIHGTISRIRKRNMNDVFYNTSWITLVIMILAIIGKFLK